ncbi:SAM-dependent methyltransferase [Microbacteriaceae bacterium SG_E_30_P1]|uniref:SAM-dependent methyltransferase n=1 Tax=Antiquaquibacter oligotrophicus TaxID=2880260 RepID=A0ABT6KQ83_9MICO|nr:SAM-dependent methyltransferase [Antiquaquibacter oligotrophicus]MDH6182129.1 SAM-dependent methyltransferase [Antiquaquibacter oligotrophicus]UDF12208.1 nodulation S family protein [Antiquaquibacter oligotrophicus]
MSLDQKYFDNLYEEFDDPWRLASGWYESRKRALTMGILPHERYTNALEIGCSIGLLTELLAPRCDRLLATDISARPLEVAQHRLASAQGVEFETRQAPHDWPGGRFDLIVISEVGYYLDEDSVRLLAERSASSLTDGGVIVACHWRHPVADYPLGGDRVHDLLAAASGLIPVATYVDDDFALEVLSIGGMPSVASLEGLTP